MYDREPLECHHRVDVKIDTYCCSLGQYVANLRFEVEVESSVSEMDMSWFVCASSTPEAAKKRFPWKQGGSRFEGKNEFTLPKKENCFPQFSSSR